jgi:cysteine desulfuration protein SufE
MREEFIEVAKNYDLEVRAQFLTDYFSKFKSWEDRYRFILNFAKLSQDLNCDLATEFCLEKFRVKGCQSQVWLKPSLKEGKLLLKSESDSQLVKGIITIICFVYSGIEPKLATDFSPHFLQTMGLSEHLSMNRSNGIASMISSLKLYSQALSQLHEKGILDVEI